MNCLAVPWSDQEYLEEFNHRGNPDVYWAPGDGEKVLFQHAYDRGAEGLPIVSGQHFLRADSPAEQVTRQLGGHCEEVVARHAR